MSHDAPPVSDKARPKLDRRNMLKSAGALLAASGAGLSSAGAPDAGKNPATMPVLVEQYVVVGTQADAQVAARLWNFEPKAFKGYENIPNPLEIQQEAEAQIPLVRDGNALVLLSFGDITERKHAEQALRDSEIRFRTLFESMDEGYCVVEMIFDDKNNPTDYRFLEVNPVFEKQTGIKDARGRLMREIAPDHEQHTMRLRELPLYRRFSLPCVSCI